MAERRKCLSTLGIQEGASEDEIKKAYKKQALQYHPDKNGSDDAKGKFQEISYAYKYLTEGPSAMGGIDVHDVRSDLFRRMFEDMFFSSFFGHGFGGGFPFVFTEDNDSDEDCYYYQSDSSDDEHYFFSSGRPCFTRAQTWGHTAQTSSSTYPGYQRPAFTQHEPSKKQQRKKEKRQRQRERQKENKAQQQQQQQKQEQQQQQQQQQKAKQTFTNEMKTGTSNTEQNRNTGHENKENRTTDTTESGRSSTPVQNQQKMTKKQKKKMEVDQRKREQEMKEIATELLRKQEQEREKQREKEKQATAGQKEEEKENEEILGWFDEGKKSRKARQREKRRLEAMSTPDPLTQGAKDNKSEGYHDNDSSENSSSSRTINPGRPIQTVKSKTQSSTESSTKHHRNIYSEHSKPDFGRSGQGFRAGGPPGPAFQATGTPGTGFTAAGPHSNRYEVLEELGHENIPNGSFGFYRSNSGDNSHVPFNPNVHSSHNSQTTSQQSARGSHTRGAGQENRGQGQPNRGRVWRNKNYSNQKSNKNSMNGDYHPNPYVLHHPRDHYEPSDSDDDDYGIHYSSNHFDPAQNRQRGGFNGQNANFNRNYNQPRGNHPFRGNGNRGMFHPQHSGDYGPQNPRFHRPPPPHAMRGGMFPPRGGHRFPPPPSPHGPYDNPYMQMPRSEPQPRPFPENRGGYREFKNKNNQHGNPNKNMQGNQPKNTNNISNAKSNATTVPQNHQQNSNCIETNGYPYQIEDPIDVLNIDADSRVSSPDLESHTSVPAAKLTSRNPISHVVDNYLASGGSQNPIPRVDKYSGSGGSLDSLDDFSPSRQVRTSSVHSLSSEHTPTQNHRRPSLTDLDARVEGLLTKDQLGVPNGIRHEDIKCYYK